MRVSWHYSPPPPILPSLPQIDSQWEDCLYRIEALNILLFMVETLSKGIDAIKKVMEVESYDNETVRNMVGDMVDHLSESLDQPLPQLPAQGFTKLDKLVWERRETEWEYLRADVDVLRMKLREKPHQELVSDVEDFMLRIKAMAVEVRT